MTQSPDILFMTEYIKHVLYFATVKQGKSLKNTLNTNYFCIDNDLIYENYHSDFGPLNLGCVYKYCRILNEKLKQHLNKQVIVHYTSIDPKKKANAAFLLGCYGVLYFSLSPRDAIKPLMIRGQSYRPFQDATQGDSSYTVTILDCLNAIKKARDLGFFNFQDFDYEEYDRLDKIQGGDLNWIVPDKFLAFIGPVDYSVSLYHPPEMYIDYFVKNDVKIVIRLNKKLYDGNVFQNAGIFHYDLFFPDGSCPPKNVLIKFLQISEESNCAIAVHCKAGLGRTGSLIGCYLIKHYRMTFREAIGWMRICRPGSVIGHQQEYLEQMEAWLIKQGNIYRKRMYHDTEKIPTHDLGLYSIRKRSLKQRSVMISKSPSPPPPLHRTTRSDNTRPVMAQASRVREAPSKTAEKELERKYEWRMRPPRTTNTNERSNSRKGEQKDNSIHRRGSGGGEPRALSPPSRGSTARTQRNNTGIKTKDSSVRNITRCQTSTASFQTSQGPVMKTINDARNFLMLSSMSRAERVKHLNTTVKVNPHSHNSRMSQFIGERYIPFNMANVIPSIHSSVVTGRDGSIGGASIGAASLGAREAPRAKRAPSVRSDERQVATQGDLLNSIKFQRRYRELLHDEKDGSLVRDKMSITPKEKTVKDTSSRISTETKRNTHLACSSSKESSSPTSRFFSPPRPSSPKGRRSPHVFY